MAATGSHQSRVPPLAYQHFRAVGAPIFDPGRDGHVLIAQRFHPDKGWRDYPIRKRVSISELRKLKDDGYTEVRLSCGGHNPDFRIAELLRSAARSPRLSRKGHAAHG